MLYNSAKLLLMAGPSLLESEKVVLKVAEALKKLSQKYPDTLTVVFRSSFDKPHRSHLYSERGIGLDAGLSLLANVKDQFDLPVATDVHERFQVEPASAICDVLQIPSLLCRHTDLMTDVAKSGCAINLRKGGHMSPGDVLTLFEKVNAAHANEIWMTERGNDFGYNNVVVDMRSFAFLKRTECPLLIDVSCTSHSPSPVTGGAKELPNAPMYTPVLAKAGLAAGAHGLYMEVHPEPENALVDSGHHLPISQLEKLIDECLRLRAALK